MSELDASAVAKLAIKVGLVTEMQMQEAWEEVGRITDPQVLLLALERKGILTPWQSSKLLKGDSSGYILGGYRLLYKVSSGSFGRVFRADEPHTGRIVAIKVLRERFSEDQHRIALFEREGKVGMALRHPNIVEILGLGRDPASRKYFIAMEFVEGGNLREILAIRKKLEPPEALRITEECVNALVYAFSKGVTHRDLKLTNVLISSTGIAKLVDYGLAGFFATSAGAALRKGDDADQMDRTVDYAGLEKGTNVKSGDVRSDIYFLGCILYEMLTGASPLQMTRDKNRRMAWDRFTRVQPMKKEDVKGPPSLFRLVETMMALNPQMRFQTPSQLLEAVKDVRREVESRDPSKKPANSLRSIFVVESDERLQEALREKLKEMGLRVLLAADPTRAVERYRQQPFDALLMDAGTVGEDGLYVFEKVLAEADRLNQPCIGVILLSEEQTDWGKRVPTRPGVAVMVRPVTIKQLQNRLRDLLGLPGKPAG